MGWIFWLTIIVLLVVLSSVGMWFYNKKEKGRGFCSITEPWIPPRTLFNFLTPEERNYILAYAEPRFEESRMVTGTDNSVRKSQTAWIERDDPVVTNIIQRVR